MAQEFLLAIDQGTTSTRALVLDRHGRTRGQAQAEFPQHFPQPGWVEHDPADIWETVRQTVPQALEAAGISAKDLAGIGLTNQRETVVLWDKDTGRPIGRAIVWQDRRTADFCRRHHQEDSWLFEKTGLILDPYFSATKLHWLFQQDESLAKQARAGKVAFGTVDSWLLWTLTAGTVHATDFSNASRTLLLDLDSRQWSVEALDFFGIPKAILPETRPSAGVFGTSRALDFLPDGLPIAGIAGDQQAALFGQGGFRAGDAKCTYGTGAFFLQHLGDKAIRSRHRLLTSLAAMIDDRPQYVLEGSIFVAGAAVQWLRDGLGFLQQAAEVETLAARSDPEQPVLFVPALVGLGAPHWEPRARGAIFGLTRNTSPADLARAALEGVALEVADLVEAAGKDTGLPLRTLRVDGGMARNAWFLARQADFLGIPVEPGPSEATSLGAAYLAGLGTGFWSGLDELSKFTAAATTHPPRLEENDRRAKRDQWHRAVQAVLAFHGE